MSLIDQEKSMLESVRTDINAFLQSFFATKVADAGHVDKHYQELWANIAELSRSGGKRFRPYMTVLAYESFGGKDRSSIIPIAAAQELLHLSMLVHDDIIDRDLVRYGVKNIQGHYETKYADYTSSTSERTHYAASAALMAGDLLLSSAYEATLLATLPLTDIQRAQSYLAAAVFSVVGGELLDTEAPLLPIHSVNTKQIALYKTASYSFNGPLLTGASLANADESTLGILSAFGEALGVAYQLKDDLLGVFGDDALTGKSTSSDISEAKRTALLQETYRRCSLEEKTVLDHLVGKPDLTDTEASTVRNIMKSSGAKAATEAIIDDYRVRASTALENLSIDPRRRTEFEALIDKVTRRST